MRILLIEDDIKIASFVIKGLKEQGYVTEHFENGKDGLNAALQDQYDAGIFDVMLPGMNGLEVIEELRENNINMPVLILSAKRSVEDKVVGINTGGDDYLTKPFAFAELLARL